MSKLYRKKPVVVEAMLFTGENFPAAVDFGCEMFFTHKDTDGKYRFAIPTLEGDMEVCVGDYIIKGVKGEFYPCKPDIFEQTYEEVNHEA